MADQIWLDDRHRLYAWSFTEELYPTLAEFVAAFVAYNEDIGEQPPVEDFVLLPSSSVFITFDGVPKDASEYENLEVAVRSESGEPLRFLEFMYSLHTQVHPYLVDADHVFYEGLTFVRLRDDIPVFELIQGS